MIKFLKTNSLIIGFIIISTLVLVMVFYSRSLSDFFIHSNDYNVRARLIETAKRLAEFTTVEELERYKTPEDTQLPEYIDLHHRLAQFAEDAEVLYAYYFRIENGLIQYIVDNDFNEETQVGLGTPPFDPGTQAESIERVITGEIAVSELGQYIEGWEEIISVYVPMFDSEGNVSAVAAVDINDTEIVQSRTHATTLLYLEIILIIGVLAYGIFCIIKYRSEATAAKEANEAKSRFLSLVSHEIRTPMNSILGITEIQLHNKKLDDELDEALENIYESGNLLLNIVNDILDMSKIEAGKLEIFPAKYDLSGLINDIMQINLIRYESKLIKFSLEIEENTPLILIGDILRLKQILNNILSNAFKYTEKGEVKLSVSCKWENPKAIKRLTDASKQVSSHNTPAEEKVTLTMRVSDTGQGITKDDIDKLFTEYTRFNQKANRKTVGTGLGLCITKRLVDLMNGEISVESTPGSGSIFTVNIPQKCSDALFCGSDLAKKIQNSHYQSASVTEKRTLQHEYMPYGRVLITDDVRSNLYVAKGLMTPYKIETETASSGFEAIEMIKNRPPYDIVFMDHMMPEMDGIETVKILRDSCYKGTIVALTANALVGHADMFLQNGFDDYLSKPIDSRELNRILCKFIRDKKPPDVVNKARREAKNASAAHISQDITPAPLKYADIPYKKSERKSLKDARHCFIIDAERAITTLERLEKDNYIGRLPGRKDLYTYKLLINKIKNEMYDIGDRTLTKQAEKLEKAAEDGNIELIRKETPAFTHALGVLVLKIQELEV